MELRDFVDGHLVVHEKQYSARGRRLSLPYAVRVVLGEIEGRVECVGLELMVRRGDTKPITAEGLRVIPLGRLIEEQRRDYVKGVKAIERSSPESVAARARRRLPAATARRRTRTARTPEQLQQVADVYNEAWRDGEPVTAAVANAMQVAKNTAPKLIAEARQAGFLPATEAGIPRGAPKKETKR